MVLALSVNETSLRQEDPFHLSGTIIISSGSVLKVKEEETVPVKKSAPAQGRGLTLSPAHVYARPLIQRLKKKTMKMKKMMKAHCLAQ